MLIASEYERKIRQAELVSKSAEEAMLDDEEAKRNHGFTQTYKKGWRRIRELAAGNPGATGLYAFFAEHIDASCGAVICDQQFLAKQLNVSTRTIRTWLNYLEEQRAIVRIPVAGKVCAYALDPHEVWKGYDNRKEYAAFVTKTLVNKDGEIQRRIMSMYGAKEGKKTEKTSPDLPFPEEGEQ